MYISLFNPLAVSSYSKNNFIGATNSSFHYVAELDKDALFSIATPSNGGNASVYYSNESTENDPILIVKGEDYNGLSYEERININEVDPSNANFIEMAALAAYLSDKGKLSNMNFLSAPNYGSIDFNKNLKFSYFDKKDYISVLENLRDNQLKNRNYNSYLILKEQLFAISKKK